MALPARQSRTGGLLLLQQGLLATPLVPCRPWPLSKDSMSTTVASMAQSTSWHCGTLFAASRSHMLLFWPQVVHAVILQDSFKPPCSNIALGDERISPFTTSYSTDFYAPFATHSRLRSPMRNKDLAATQTSLKEHYASSYNRVGE